MDFLRSAAEAVQRNFAALALYIVSFVGITLATDAIQWAALNHGGMDPKTYETGLVGILVTVALTMVGAVPHTIAFAWMGREIDRPLWRMKDGWDALKRFYFLWLIMDLIVPTLLRLTDPKVYGIDADGLPLFGLLLFFVFNALSTPIGACIMFSGHLDWHKLGDVLMPLIRQISKTSIAVGIATFQCLFIVTVNSMVSNGTDDFTAPFSHLGAKLVLLLVNGYLDCLVFACVWLLCMHDRETPDDFDMEF